MNVPNLGNLPYQTDPEAGAYEAGYKAGHEAGVTRGAALSGIFWAVFIGALVLIAFGPWGAP